MTTVKASLLGVTIPEAQTPFPVLKKAKLVKEKDYPYEYISYELFGKSQETFTFNETATALARLISPIRELTKVELEKFPKLVGYFLADKIDNDSIINFVNRYGQAGIADISRREIFSYPDFVGNAEAIENFCSLVGIYTKPEITKTKAYFKANPKEFFKRRNRIFWGAEVPISWLNADLRYLYSVIRVLEILKEKKLPEFNLSRSVELRRFIHASDNSPFIIPFGKEAGRYKELDPKWTEINAERLVEKFTLNANRFLQPITRNPLQTEKQSETNSQSFGIETFLVYSILKFGADFNERFCEKENCQRPFYPQRSSGKFCSVSCASAGRQERYRKKLKVSAQASRKKATTKRKKGKNG